MEHSPFQKRKQHKAPYFYQDFKCIPCIFRVVGTLPRGPWTLCVSKLPTLTIWFPDTCWTRRVTSWALGLEDTVLAAVVTNVTFSVTLWTLGELTVGEDVGLREFWCWASSSWRRALVRFWVMLGLAPRRLWSRPNWTEWGSPCGASTLGDPRVTVGDAGLPEKTPKKFYTWYWYKFSYIFVQFNFIVDYQL